MHYRLLVALPLTELGWYFRRVRRVIIPVYDVSRKKNIAKSSNKKELLLIMNMQKIPHSEEWGIKGY